jgi:glutamine amidotransferase
MLSDGTSLVSTCAGNSLFTRDLGTARIVASEPFDDDAGWIAVPDNSIVTATAAGIVVEPF